MNGMIEGLPVMIGGLVVLWWIPLVLRIFLANGVSSILIKKNSGQLDRTKRFFFQFLFCSLIMLGVALLTGKLVFGGFAVMIFLMGMFNGIAGYCQWRAIDISLSKNSIFTFWDDVTAMTLAYFFLHESKLFNGWLISGTVLSLLSVILFSIYNYKKSRKNDKNSDNLFGLLGFVAVYSLIWGVLVFLMRYLAVNEVPMITFLVFWYSGACLTALGIFLGFSDRNIYLPKKDIFSLLILSSSIITALASTYWAYQAAPLNISQPVFLVGEMIVPSLIGLYYFKEIKELDLKQKIFFGIGICGSLMVVLSV